jgi:hypothetical protein
VVRVARLAMPWVELLAFLGMIALAASHGW